MLLQHAIACYNYELNPSYANDKPSESQRFGAQKQAPVGSKNCCLIPAHR